MTVARRPVRVGPSDLARAARLHALHQERYARDAVGLVADLEDAGFHVERLHELRRPGVGNTTALPILIRWLHALPCSPLKRDVCYVLGSSWARPGAASALLAEYHMLDDRDDLCAALTRAAILTSLERVADDGVFSEVVAIATDAGRGVARGMAVVALGNMRRHRTQAVEALRGLLADDSAATFAVLGLAKLDARETLHDIVAVIGRGDPVARRTARRVARRWSELDEQGRGDGGQMEPVAAEHGAAGLELEGQVRAGVDLHR